MDKVQLVLGTAQLGMCYGYYKKVVLKIRKPTTEQEAHDILSALGPIKIIETAQVYGNAEKYIGSCDSLPPDVQIVTKIWPATVKPEVNIGDEIKASSERLGRRLFGVMFHTPQYIYNAKLVAQLFDARDKGYVDKIGVSVYETAHAEDAIDAGIDLLSMPYSVFDQRLVRTGLLKRAQEKGVLVFARSPFCQGLLLALPDSIPDYMDYARRYVKRFRNIIAGYDFSPAQAAFLFALHTPNLTHVLFGVDNPSQLKEDLSMALREWDFDDCFNTLADEFAKMPRSITFPSIWEVKRTQENVRRSQND